MRRHLQSLLTLQCTAVLGRISSGRSERGAPVVVGQLLPAAQVVLGEEHQPPLAVHLQQPHVQAGGAAVILLPAQDPRLSATAALRQPPGTKTCA